MNIANIQNELHLRDYLEVIHRRRSVVTLFFILVVSVVIAGSFMINPVYRATTTLLIDEEGPNVLTTTGNVSLEPQNYYSYKEYYQSQIEILTSQGLLRKVFNEFKLGSLEEFAKAKEPIIAFIKTVKVEPIRDTRLLKLHVENKDPELAAKISNRIAELYVKRNLNYISRNELMNLLKNEYLKLETKLSEYNKIYKDKHPEMIRLKEEIAELVQKIERVKKSAFDYDTLKQDIQSQGQYTLEGLKANNVSIQDPAEKPIVPIRPKKTLNILIGIIVGIFGGITLAFFFEYLDDTVKNTEDIERLLKWPLLGNVPEMDISGKMSEFEKDILVHSRPKDPIAEGYRAIRTSVVLSNTEEHHSRCLVVTSPGPQEGKTTTLCNLGISLAQNQKQVLLVDSDMRKPRLHDIFKKNNSFGLSTYLSEQSNFEDIIQPTDIANLYLVNGGAHPPNPSELLASHKLKEFVEKAKNKFDYVLFDSPPIAVVTDAMIISQVVDGAIIVVEGGKTPKRVLPRFFQLLQDAKIRVVGTVLNKVTFSRNNYYYYSNY